MPEVVKIMECKNEYGQTVIPVFYDVDPSQHEILHLDFLIYINNLSYIRRTESKSIQQIVDQISTKLCKTLSSLQDFVGINTHLERLRSLLKTKTSDSRIVGIWGMDGVGKTTIARTILDTLSYQFKAACFLANVKENEKRHQLHFLQNILLSELLKHKAHYVNNKDDGTCMIMSRLRFKKVLIVLDDIYHNDHLDYLAGDLSWFGNGSRVVVTTRDSHLIGKHDALYEVTIVTDHEAIQLFNHHAFKNEVPNERFEKLSWEVVNHAKGFPLALKVWGSFLHKRGITEWISSIVKMKNKSNMDIVEKLKISYDGLEPIKQEMFLDIAYVSSEGMKEMTSCKSLRVVILKLISH
uniref:TMV resistance protein N-like n=1 Tax=Nicotiana tabacum TaxID=4097 RepID=A0A1S4A644_TOBAC|nr:PREDICTED: TMV resistance protein N-like [Nicotiana tabacum]